LLSEQPLSFLDSQVGLRQLLQQFVLIHGSTLPPANSAVTGVRLMLTTVRGLHLHEDFSLTSSANRPLC
jgi:hypothetical protein